jgi:hypothetical protein
MGLEAVVDRKDLSKLRAINSDEGDAVQSQAFRNAALRADPVLDFTAPYA